MKLSPRSADFDTDLRLVKISVLAIFVGAVCTVVAYILLSLIAIISNLLFHQNPSFTLASPAGNDIGWWVIAVPAFGGLIAGLMARYGSELIRGHGIPEALEAILYSKSRLSFRVAILKPISSAIVIGTGGPFGAEGPIIMTGGSVGSLIAQVFTLTSIERRILLVAGACGGMAATFNTPIAASLLGVELLLFELKPRSMIPVALASATAAALRPLLIHNGGAALFLVHGTIHITPVALGSAAVCGLLGGVLAAILTWAVYASEDLFGKLPIHWMWWPAIGGLIVGLGGYFQPHALGVGYDDIRELLNGTFGQSAATAGHAAAAGHIAIFAIISLLVVKLIIWALALGSGTSGGILAPLLMMGACLGALESLFLPGGSTLLWPLLGMGAALAGVMRSPFTAIVFVLELTHALAALPPLLITCTIAYGFSVLVMKRSILTEKIARHGRHIFREYAVDPLVTMFVAQLMTTTLETIPDGTAVFEAEGKYFGSSQMHRAYPVTGEGGTYIGIVTREDLRNWHNGSPERTLGECLAGQQRIVAFPGETVHAAATRMAQHQIERIAVIDNDSKLVGMLARSDIVRGFSVHYENEHVRERYITMHRRPREQAKPDKP